MKRADKPMRSSLRPQAYPAPVAQTFFVDQEVADRTKLDAIVTIGRGAGASVRRNYEAFADVVLLNKTDLVDPVILDRVCCIKKINPYTKIQRTTSCDFSR